MKHSDWLAFGQDFTVQAITMETARFGIFSLSLEIQVERKTNSFLKAGFVFFFYFVFFITTVQL